MNIVGTKSEENVKMAFAGESQARNKYTYYAMQAEKEGNDEIAQMFERMANNEKEHAKIWFKLLHDGLGDSETNVRDAAQGENYEWKSMYPDFAKQAREDGFEMLAIMFEKIAAIENDHERKFLETYLNMVSAKTGHNTEKAAPVLSEPSKPYRCMFCGNLEDTPLDYCPVCEAIGSFERV